MTWLAHSERTGYRRWRTLGNGLVVWRRGEGAFRHYRAFDTAGELVATYGIVTSAGAPPPSGHVGGDYSRVQGADADCKALQEWLAAVAAMEAVA